MCQFFCQGRGLFHFKKKNEEKREKENRKPSGYKIKLSPITHGEGPSSSLFLSFFLFLVFLFISFALHACLILEWTTPRLGQRQGLQRAHSNKAARIKLQKKSFSFIDFIKSEQLHIAVAATTYCRLHNTVPLYLSKLLKKPRHDRRTASSSDLLVQNFPSWRSGFLQGNPLDFTILCCHDIFDSRWILISWF